ncbi:hypothetical protein [Azohydromonas australica]|uniref:hypothetical protein n=1 Tax=Azohydromonas australica TaxID=364039 RepID=UPI0012EC6332|nr:hypothetical protein [Azohydromonas australica]
MWHYANRHGAQQIGCEQPPAENPGCEAQNRLLPGLLPHALTQIRVRQQRADVAHEFLHAAAQIAAAPVFDDLTMLLAIPGNEGLPSAMAHISATEKTLLSLGHDVDPARGQMQHRVRTVGAEHGQAGGIQVLLPARSPGPSF